MKRLGGMDPVSARSLIVMHVAPIDTQLGHRGGVFAARFDDPSEQNALDPFDLPGDSPLSSPSSSEEELYNKLALQEPLAPRPIHAAGSRRPPPPPPRSTKPPLKDVS